MVKQAVVEIEIDGARNEAHFFRPLMRRLRGRFDLNRVAEPQARMKSVECPDPIPGLRIGLDFVTATGYVSDPLTEPEQAANRARITQRGLSLGSAREDFPEVDCPTWAFWLRRAVESGAARVVRGELPEELGGAPVTSCVTARRPNSADRLAEAIENNTRVLAAVLEKLAGK